MWIQENYAFLLLGLLVAIRSSYNVRLLGSVLPLLECRSSGFL